MTKLTHAFFILFYVVSLVFISYLHFSANDWVPVNSTSVYVALWVMGTSLFGLFYSFTMVILSILKNLEN